MCQECRSTDKTHLSIVNSNIHLEDLAQDNLTHRWNTNPVIHLEEVRQQPRMNKFVASQESLTTMAQSSSSSSNIEQQQENLSEIADKLEKLKNMRATLLTLKESNIEDATQFGRDIMMITSDLLLRVVKQIGQTNVQTTTLESIIAYIRNLIHTRSAHMRQSVPGPLLIAWYDSSQLMSALQKEPELRITIKKARQLVDVAHDTAAWAYKYLSTEYSNTDQIGFIDRTSIPYTNE